MSAYDQGWGLPGSKSFIGQIVRIKAAGIYLQVNSETAPLWKAALDEVAVHGGYDFSGVADDWGYAFRPVRGYEDEWKHTHNPDFLSNHSWGNAVDLNATKNPMTENPKIHGDMPQWVVDIFAKYGLLWGGNYKGKRKDYMHFEFVGTPAEARRRVANLRTPQLTQKELFPVDQFNILMNAVNKVQQRVDEIAADINADQKRLANIGGDLFEIKYRIGIPDGPTDKHPRTEPFNGLLEALKK